MPSIKITRNGDDELQIPPNDIDNLAVDSQPEVEAQQPAEIPTDYSPRRQRKSIHNVFDISQHEIQAGGNDPFDYEKKFSEDKQYEELGPLARIWRIYLEECAELDAEMAEGWRDGLDVLLVFAGLFSAVVTTFVVQTSQSLQANYSQVTASLLFELIDVMRAAANGSLSVNNVPRSDLTPFSGFHPTTSDIWVNGLWFTSLNQSRYRIIRRSDKTVDTSVHGGFIRDTPGTMPRTSIPIYGAAAVWCGFHHWVVTRALERVAWCVSSRFGYLPCPATSVDCIRCPSHQFMSFGAYFITNLLPIWYPSCSYKTPLSQYAFLLYMYLTRHPFFVSAISRLWVPPPSAQTDESQDEPPESSSVKTLRDAERAAVEVSVDEMDVLAFAWLFNISTNPSVQSIVVQSTSALPLPSIGPLKQRAKGISDMCETLIWQMGRHPWPEGFADRFARASLRLVLDGERRGLAWTLLDAEAGHEHWPQDVYAEVLAVVTHRLFAAKFAANIIALTFYLQDYIFPWIYFHLAEQ